jgi:hypothetical protein
LDSSSDKEGKNMPNKAYTVRISGASPEITTEQVGSWLLNFGESSGQLAADPGAGERSLRLSLDKESVQEGARAAGEPEATFLRRLIATNISLAETNQGATEERGRPRPVVLKGAMKLRPDQVQPLVRVFEAGQALAIRKTFHLPAAVETVQATAFTEEERERLSAVSAEVINRRAPAWLVENGDIFALLTEIGTIESRKIEAALALAEQIRQLRAEQSTQTDSSGPSPNEQ